MNRKKNQQNLDFSTYLKEQLKDPEIKKHYKKIGNLKNIKVKKLKIALLGSLPKGDNARKDFIDWKIQYVEKITKAIPEALFLHGDLISDSKGSEIVVGHDLWLIKRADIVVVNAPAKIGAGTAQELIMAKKFKKPVITLIPKNTHHRKSNITFHGITIKDWIHPFIDITSDAVVEDVEGVIRWIKSYKRKPKKIKDISILDKSISRFEKSEPKITKQYKKLGW